MAVPAARICASPGVVLHKPGGHVKPPSPPLCRGGSPPSAAYLRRTGVADAPTYPDLYYIPPDVAAAKQLPPGWYATLSAGDEFEVVVAAPGWTARSGRLPWRERRPMQRMRARTSAASPSRGGRFGGWTGPCGSFGARPRRRRR